ncbi:hypothetical protein BDZ91DRAFT_762649 [Kalaharituber pfeilii]|nr:hypothetical protein BDZ91DRAFT_762649 [Kalaharituber pfeilii]
MDPIISNKVVHGPRYGGKWDSVSVYHGTFDPTVPPDIKSRFLEWKEKEEAKTEKEAEREREKAQERERRHKEFAKDDKKIIPHPVPVIPPYQKIPSQQLTAEIGGSSKQTNQHHLEYQKQKAQPKSVKELQVEVPEEPAKVVEVKSGPATPMKSGRVSIGVSPLQAEGMKIVQASEGPEAVEVNVPEMGTCGA